MAAKSAVVARRSVGTDGANLCFAPSALETNDS